jgi:hypothetical protein
LGLAPTMNHFGKFVNRFQLKQRSKLSQAASMRKPLADSINCSDKINQKYENRL